MSKVVVLFHYPDSDSQGQKIFDRVIVDNNERGELVIKQVPKNKMYPVTIAVFREWLYWEKIE